MLQWLLGDGAAWFSVPAIVATVFFGVELVLGQFAGAQGGLDADLPGGDVPLDGVDMDGSQGHSPGSEMRWLSLQSLAAFAMGSGWMGLAVYRFFETSIGVACLAAVGAGAGTAWLVASATRAMLRLQSSGNVSLDDAVGALGRVYVSVPPAGRGAGRVTLVVHNMQQEMNAVQRGAEPIASRTAVRVIDVESAANAVVVQAE